MELTYANYQEYKKELDGELKKSAEGFVRIGYLLRVARDTNVLAGSGYGSVTEFAQAEYGLDKSQVSRFISINERFANGGENLLPQYEEYGYAKLTIMLQIPTEIAEELTPEYSKAEIQAVKEELDEEKKVSDLEILMEKKKDEEETVLFRTVKQLCHDDPDLYERLWAARLPFNTWDEFGPIIAPSGDKVYSVRIPGAGRVMMTMQDGRDEITITNTRTFEKVITSRQEMVDELVRILRDAETAADAWEKVYLEPWPKGKVAPVQPVEPQKEKTREKPAKKESKVSKAKKPEKPKKTSTEPTPAAVVEEPQLPEQISVEDYPELMPDGGENDGTNTGMDAGNVQLGEPDRSGDETADGGSKAAEGTEGDEIQSTDESDGAAESGGREADHEKLVNEAWWKWMDLRQAMPPTRMVITAKVKELYNLTIKLAAALEELINEG